MSTGYDYQKVRQRKFIYAGIIVLLFILGLVHRLQVLETSARENSLEVSNLGRVDMGGELSRYLLASFRGPLICGLWWEANEKKERHEYDQMEVIIEALTKLQPHFKGPWKFQGWNLAYNVAVEFDRVEDKYYYVARGVRWYYEGDRINVARLYDEKQPDKYRLVGDPDLRKDLAYTVADKAYASDEGEYFRCFLQLSCIHPDVRQRGDRDESRYVALLHDFMEKYPILTRRIQQLRDVPDGDRPQLLREVRAFLEQYQASERRGNMPSRYKVMTEQEEQEAQQQLANTNLSDAERAELNRKLRETPRPFPVWPPGKEPTYGVERESAGIRPGRPMGIVRLWFPDQARDWFRLERYHYGQDGYDIARRWYEYSQEPLPPPNADWSKDYDAQAHLGQYHRLHKQGTTMSFRAFPPKMRSQLARALAANGWRRDSQGTWELAFDEWLAFGRANGLEKSPPELKALREASEYYQLAAAEAGAGSGMSLSANPQGALDKKRLEEGQKAYLTLRRISQQQGFAHYNRWRVESEIGAGEESGENLAQARYHWYRASRLPGDPQAALDEYDQGVVLWRKLLGPSQPLMKDILETVDICAMPLLMPSTEMALLGRWPLPEGILRNLRVHLKQVPQTPFAASEMTQQELFRLQGDYLSVRSKRLAPHWLGVQHALLRLGHGLTPLTGGMPLGSAALQAAQPAAFADLMARRPSPRELSAFLAQPALGVPGANWITMERIEDWLEDTKYMPGPFSAYIQAEVQSNADLDANMRSFREENRVGWEARRKAMEQGQKQQTGSAVMPIPPSP